ncbi:MAG: hypothetical protein L0Z48_08490 [candidate division Zixibacteria bacterium]|nr:hypothetical protein [candidate division Zixibacteria bacterium]
MTQEEIEKYKSILLELIPKNGSTIGNVKLLRELRERIKHFAESDYWEIRNSLIDEGILSKARGKGGSVYRLRPVETAVETSKTKIKESSLYQSFRDYIEKFWVKDNDIKDFVLEKTAMQGKRNTGGKWTRPDFALITVRTYEYIPGKILELITFEVKPANDFRIEGVFETAAHSKFAHRSYLSVFSPKGPPDTDEFERLKDECERFRIGLITFSDPGNRESYETIVEAERKNPDPDDINGFISSQIHKENQKRVLQMVK